MMHPEGTNVARWRVNIISESAFTVQGHGVHSAFEDSVESLKRYTNCEVLVNSNQAADVIHVHSPGPYSLIKLLFGKGAKVVSAHVTPDSFVGSIIGAKYWYWLASVYLRWFYNRADAVLGVSNEVIDELQRLGVKKQLWLAPNTIPTQRFRVTAESRRIARDKLGIGPGEFVVMGCGQVQPRKRVNTFTLAAKSLPQIRFVWVGGMPFGAVAAEHADMKKLMSANVPNLTFTGLVPRETVEAWYRASDLFFLPSVQETFGLVIVEAAASGLPVLLRDLEQYKQTFGSGYESGTDEDFTTKIGRFSRDHEYYEQWKHAARAIAEKYDSKVGAERLMEIYGQVLAQRQPKTKEARS